MPKILFLLIIIAAGSLVVFGQGGTANTARIEFINGKARVSGSLATGRVTDYRVLLTKDQIITITNSSYRLFDFRVFHDKYFDEGDFDSSPNYTFEVPKTGDYLFSVRKKVAGPRTARYSMTIIIK